MLSQKFQAASHRHFLATCSWKSGLVSCKVGLGNQAPVLRIHEEIFPRTTVSELVLGAILFRCRRQAEGIAETIVPCLALVTATHNREASLAYRLILQLMSFEISL